MLLTVLRRLVASGNTVIIIEHNLDVIKTADWIIDLGPEGGHAGGRLVAEGTPEAVANVEASYTGRYLKKTSHESNLKSDRMDGHAPVVPAARGMATVRVLHTC